MTRAWRRVALSTIASALAFTGALAIQAIEPSYEERFRPIASHGTLGETVTTRDFSIRVDRVAVVRSLLIERTEVTTSGVWVIVRTTIASRREPISVLSGVYLRTQGGALYHVNHVLTGRANPSDPLQPLLPQPRTFFFEIPANKLAGAQLWVSQRHIVWHPAPFDKRWFTPQARIDLGIEAHRAAQLVRDALRRYRVPEVP